MKLQKILDNHYLNKYIAPGKYIDENGNDIVVSKPELIIEIDIKHIKDEQIILVLEQGKTIMIFIEEHISLIDYNKQKNINNLGDIRQNLKNHFNDISSEDIDSIVNMIQEYLNNANKKVDMYRKQASEHVTLYSKQIRGALKNCIHAHGPITMEYIPSITKRIVQYLAQNADENQINIIDNIDD